MSWELGAGLGLGGEVKNGQLLLEKLGRCEVDKAEGRREGVLSGSRTEMEAKGTNQLSSPAASTLPN